MKTTSNYLITRLTLVTFHCQPTIIELCTTCLFTIFKCQKCDTVLSNDKINLELIIWHSKCWWIKSYTVKLKELYILELNWEYQMKDDDEKCCEMV